MPNRDGGPIRALLSATSSLRSRSERVVSVLTPSLLAAFLLSASIPCAAVSQTSGSPSLNADEYASDRDGAIRSLDRFWTAEFPRSFNKPWTKLKGFFAYNKDIPAKIPCWTNVINAFYCPDADVILLEETHMLRPWHSQFEDFAAVYVIAHEWGHAVQSRLRLLNPYFVNQTKELQADCFGGVWADNAERLGELQKGDLDEVMVGLLNARDPPGTSWLDPQGHGTGAMRIEAFNIGRRGGAKTCLGPMPPPSHERGR